MRTRSGLMIATLLTLAANLEACGTIKPKDKDMDQLIFDVAEFGRDSDIAEIYARLKALELYAPVISANFEAPIGERVMIGPGMEVQIPVAKIRGLEFAAFFVNRDDKRLGSKFVMMSVAEAFGMVEKTNHLDGIVLYNDKESYFGIARKDFDRIRHKYLG